MLVRCVHVIHLEISRGKCSRVSDRQVRRKNSAKKSILSGLGMSFRLPTSCGHDTLLLVREIKFLIHFLFLSFLYYFRYRGTAVAQWLRCCATNRKVAGSIPAGVIGFSIGVKSFRSHYGPGVDSAFKRNEYQEHFLGVKAAGT